MDKFEQSLKDKLSGPQKAPENSWANISAALDKKKKRLIPIWTIIPAGIAAVFLIGFFVLRPGEKKLPASHSLAKRTSWRKSSSQELSSKERSSRKLSPPELPIQKLSVQKSPSPAVLSLDKEIAVPRRSLHRNLSTDNEKYAEGHQSSTPSQIFEGPNQKGSTYLTAIFGNQENEVSPLFNDVERFKNNPPSVVFNMPNTERPEKTRENEWIVKSDTKKPKFKKEKNETEQKLSVSAYVGKAFVQAFSGRSMLSTDFEKGQTGNAMTYETGANIGYAISDKIRLRTGLGILDLEQQTSNVPISMAYASPSSDFIYFKALGDQANIPVHYQGAISVLAKAPDGLLQSSGISGQLTQKIQYLEIPVEMDVQLFEVKNFRISGIMGGSSYLLSKNSIIVNAGQNISQKLGNATNLNSFSFSGNAGVKFDYQISKDFRINVIPMLKYMVVPINNIQKDRPVMGGITVGGTVSF